MLIKCAHENQHQLTIQFSYSIMFAVHCLLCIDSVDSQSVSATSQELPTKSAANKPDSDVDTEDSHRPEEKKSPNRRSVQAETKDDVGSVSLQLIIFMSRVVFMSS